MIAEKGGVPSAPDFEQRLPRQARGMPIIVVDRNAGTAYVRKANGQVVQIAGGAGSPAWGAITGTLASQADLQAALNAKAASAHNHDLLYAAIAHGHAIAEITALQAALDARSLTSHHHDGAYAALAHAHAGVYEPANVNLQAHVAQAHAPANAQKNSDITLAEIEAKLTGVISSHSHAGGGGSPFMFEGSTAADLATGANVTPISLTGLVFTFEANSRYWVEIVGATRAAAATTGSGFQLDTSVAVTRVGLTFGHQLANTGTMTGGSSIADDASVGVSSGRPSANVDTPTYGSGYLVSGANGGTAQLRYRSEVAAVSTVMAGFMMRVRKMP